MHSDGVESWVIERNKNRHEQAFFVREGGGGGPSVEMININIDGHKQQ